jgi:hypothetical protein
LRLRKALESFRLSTLVRRRPRQLTSVHGPCQFGVTASPRDGNEDDLGDGIFLELGRALPRCLLAAALALDERLPGGAGAVERGGLENR